MIPRRRGWRADLLAWATRTSGRRFVWGETDCISLTRQTIDILFGPELLAGLPTWHTRAEAEALRAVFDPIPVLRQLGAQQVGVPFRRGGDILVLDAPEEVVGKQTFAVCVDGRVGITSSPRGVSLLDCATLPPTTLCFTLWEANPLVFPTVEMSHG